MADKDLKVEEAPKKKSKLMLIIIIALVLLAAGGAAAYFFLFASDDSSTQSDVSGGPMPERQDVERPSGAALYVAMPRPFQFNSPGISRERIVQIDVQLLVRGKDNEEIAKRHIPMIEGTLLQVFSASNADDLVTDVGKTDLRNRATSQVQAKMNELESTPVIEEVLFTGFVIQ